MRVSTDVRSRFITAALLAYAIVALPGRAAAQCVGDCSGDGEVSISDLIVGVNIALGSSPVSSCEAFADSAGEVTIAQLIQGVNNALNGCPPPASTPTATATATATSTDTPSATATASATAPTSTATSPASTATATDTATAVSTATATHTASSTMTASAEATATATATQTTTSSATATASPTQTSSPTVTATLAPSSTPTDTPVPPGDSIAGRAALLSSGLSGIQAIVAAVVTAATNNGGAATLVFGVEQGIGPPIDVDACPLGGQTTQSCTEMGSGFGKTINLVLGANSCIAPGPVGGSGEFSGTITINSTPFFLNACSPLAFLSGAYDVDALTVVLRNAMMDLALTVAVDVGGNLTITSLDQECLVGSLSLSVTGTLTSLLPDGTGVEVLFQNTAVTMTSINYNNDCVPLVYTLTFNGDAVFTPLSGALLEVAAALNSPGSPEQAFDVTFTNFALTQNATTSPVVVEMDGSITSDCFGGLLVLDTTTPIAVAAGQLCPNSGVLNVTGSGTSASVTYDDGGVTVTPMGGMAESYQSCLDPALLMCPA